MSTKLLILVKITDKEGESSSKITILRIDKVIKKAKDLDRDIKMSLNNNITIKRLIKVALLSKFSKNPEKLEEYLNKT